MRWFSLFILAYLIVGIQFGAGPFLRIANSPPPNLVLLAVAFIAINAPPPAAMVGCIIIGLFQDLTTGQPPGLYAFSYGLFAMIVSRWRWLPPRGSPITHVIIAFTGAMLTALVLYLQGVVHPDVPAHIIATNVYVPAVRASLGWLLLGALYTTALAPIVMGLLHRSRGIFAFAPARRRRMAM
jgi:rod shape-determining protein MreD